MHLDFTGGRRSAEEQDPEETRQNQIFYIGLSDYNYGRRDKNPQH
jgi:hypothetical protein